MYRIEMGETRVPQSQQNGQSQYTDFFLGFSRKFGGLFFAEPEFKVRLPLRATLQQALPGEPLRAGPMVEHHFGIREVNLALSLKLGIGFN